MKYLLAKRKIMKSNHPDKQKLLLRLEMNNDWSMNRRKYCQLCGLKLEKGIEEVYCVRCDDKIYDAHLTECFYDRCHNE